MRDEALLLLDGTNALQHPRPPAAVLAVLALSARYIALVVDEVHVRFLVGVLRVDDVDAEEQGVVHDLEALESPAVALDGVHEAGVYLRLEVDTLGVHLQEVQVLEGRVRFLALLLTRLAPVSRSL